MSFKMDFHSNNENEEDSVNLNNDSERTCIEFKNNGENSTKGSFNAGIDAEVTKVIGVISYEGDVNDLQYDINEEYDDVFGDDWIGKPGVSSESESDDIPSEYNIQEYKKRTKINPMPSHIAIIEGDPISYKCLICVKTFGSKGHVRYHSYCDQSTKPYKCHLCSRSFSKKNVLNYHVKTHTGEKPFACSMCDKKFLQLDKLKRHKQIHLGNNLECNECSAKFRDMYSLNVHKKSHSLTNFYIYKCNSCVKSFKDKSNLNKHVKGVHSKTKKYVCEHCGKGFDWKYNLVCHIRTHSGVRAFACDKCSRTFKNQNDCHKHKLTHTDLREYRCNVCDGSFKRRDNLVRHLRNIHPEQDPKKITKFQEQPLSSQSTSSSGNMNRISVIKRSTPIYPNEPVQQSVIKHSGHASNQEFKASNNIRKCVIESTR